MVNELLGERLFSAAVTPMASDESVDLDALAAMIDADLARGVEGLYVCGSSGEGVLLSEAERKGIARTAVTVAAGRTPVVSHIGAMSTGEAIRLAEDAKDAGVTAISMIPPLYYGYSTPEVVRHFRAVIDAVDLPFVLYNIVEGVFGAAKYLGGKNSVPLGDCRRPLPTLDDAARARLDGVWERLQQNIARTIAEERDANPGG